MKTFTKILLSFTLLISFASNLQLCLAAPLENSDLMARVTLDPSFKPDNSPGVIISEESLKKAGAEAAFGNYLLQMLAGGLITIAAPVAIIVIAISGLMAVVSHGNPGLMEKAKKTLKWAVIGLIIIIFSWVIIRGIISVVLNANTSPTTSSSTAGSEAKPPTSSEPSTGGGAK